MSNQQFNDEYIKSQDLARILQQEVLILECLSSDQRTYAFNSSPSAQNSPSDDTYDPELGNSSEFSVKSLMVKSLLADLRTTLNLCEQLAINIVDRAKLHRLERQYSELQGTHQRLTQFVMEQQRKLSARRELFSSRGALPPSQIQSSSTSGIDNVDRNAYFQEEQKSLQAMLKTVNGTIANAFSSLESFQRQRSLFLSIQQQSVNIAESLGLSQNVVSWIRSQENINTLIVVLGSIFTVFIVFVFYLWWKS